MLTWELTSSPGLKSQPQSLTVIEIRPRWAPSTRYVLTLKDDVDVHDMRTGLNDFGDRHTRRDRKSRQC